MVPYKVPARSSPLSCFSPAKHDRKKRKRIVKTKKKEKEELQAKTRNEVNGSHQTQFEIRRKFVRPNARSQMCPNYFLFSLLYRTFKVTQVDINHVDAPFPLSPVESSLPVARRRSAPVWCWVPEAVLLWL